MSKIWSELKDLVGIFNFKFEMDKDVLEALDKKYVWLYMLLKFSNSMAIKAFYLVLFWIYRI